MDNVTANSGQEGADDLDPLGLGEPDTDKTNANVAYYPATDHCSFHDHQATHKVSGGASNYKDFLAKKLPRQDYLNKTTDRYLIKRRKPVGPQKKFVIVHKVNRTMDRIDAANDEE